MLEAFDRPQSQDKQLPDKQSQSVWEVLATLIPEEQKTYSSVPVQSFLE